MSDSNEIESSEYEPSLVLPDLSVVDLTTPETVLRKSLVAGQPYVGAFFTGFVLASFFIFLTYRSEQAMATIVLGFVAMFFFRVSLVMDNKNRQLLKIYSIFGLTYKRQLFSFSDVALVSVSAKAWHYDVWYRPTVILRCGTQLDKFIGFNEMKLHDANTLAEEIARHLGAKFIAGKEECRIWVNRIDDKGPEIKHQKTSFSRYDTEGIACTIVGFLGMGIASAVFWVVCRAYA